MKRALRPLMPILLSLALADGADAHHSFVMFDQQKSITIKGTVNEFQWTNPHCWIQLLVPSGGATVEWSIEMLGPGGLVKQGWKPASLAAGDNVTITLHPLRSGQTGGSFMSIILPDGRKLGGDQIAEKKGT